MVVPLETVSVLLIDYSEAGVVLRVKNRDRWDIGWDLMWVCEGHDGRGRIRSRFRLLGVSSCTVVLLKK
jgi:hypothetical protein